MLPRLRRRHFVVGFLVSAFIALSIGCSGLLGFDDFVVNPSSEASTTDGPNEAGDASDEEASCGVDLTKECYPCEPGTTDQFLNSCTAAQCIPFDRGRLSGLLLPDGALPPLPPPDGG